MARYDGCPVPDTDGDGVNDESDKCPNEAGPQSNQGCPEKPVVEKPQIEEVKKKIDVAAKQIYFETGKATLLKKSNAALQQVIAILKENPEVKLSIDGHTDNTGNAKTNKTLSQNRANAVQKYLVKQGIDAQRLVAKGFGQTVPIASNKTAAGRAKNRRVEMNIMQ